MKPKNQKINFINRQLITRAIFLLVALTLAEVVGGITGIGFAGFLILLGGIVVLFNANYGENVQFDSFQRTMMKSDFINHPLKSNYRRANATINIDYGVDYLYIGTGLIALGFLATFTNLSFVSTLVLIAILVMIYVGIMYRRVLLHQDALSESAVIAHRNSQTEHDLTSHHPSKDIELQLLDDDDYEQYHQSTQ